MKNPLPILLVLHTANNMEQNYKYKVLLIIVVLLIGEQGNESLRLLHGEFALLKVQRFSPWV